MEKLSTESRALRRSNAVFKRGVDPNNIVTVLYSNFLLTPEEKADATQPTKTDDQKLESIFTTLERRVFTRPEDFHTLLEALRDEPATEAVADKIQAKYDEELAKEKKTSRGGSSGQKADSGQNGATPSKSDSGGETKTPTMRELDTHVKISHEWSRFATFLIDEGRIPAISRDTALPRVSDKLNQVFHIFLYESKKEPTWKAVVEALEAIDQYRLAGKIQKEFCVE